MPEPNVHAGGCHCGSVRFEVKTGLDKLVSCNCSICGKTGAIYAFVPASEFTLLKGADAQSDYQFNKKVIHHLFCKTCGIRSFGRGKGPDGTEMIAVNVRCLDDVDVAALKPMAFDGKSL